MFHRSSHWIVPSSESEVSNMPTCSSRLLVPSLRHTNRKRRWWEQESVCWICFIVVQGSYTQRFGCRNWSSVSPRDTTWWPVSTFLNAPSHRLLFSYRQWHSGSEMESKDQYDEQLTTDVRLLQIQTKLWMTHFGVQKTIGVSKCPSRPWFWLLVLDIL